MNLVTDIVLVGDNGATNPYMIELISENQLYTFIFKRQGDKHFSLFPSNLSTKLSQNGNEWYETDDEGESYQLYASKIRLYFPQYSVDTYSSKSTYILNLYTYINGNAVELGCYKFNRSDALACPPVVFDGMDEYYEYMDFMITNPFKLHYDDDTEPIRSALGEPLGMNNTGSLLYASINVVEEGENCYIKKNNWTSGQNSILIYDPQDLKLSLSYSNASRSVHLELTWNETYDSLYDYIQETYHSDHFAIVWEYVIMDKNDIFYRQSKTIKYLLGDFNYDFSYDFSVDKATGPVDPESDIPVTNSDMFSSWDNWKEGMIIQGSASFIDVNSIDEEDGDIESAVPFITIFSNKIPLSQDLFSRMIVRPGYEQFPEIINLSQIDMNNINLTAINKIEQNITVVTPTDTAKNHVIQPVFYQTRDLSSIAIHPSVVENISLNLDSYKSRVSSFKVQIEGVVFPEIGRTNKGVVFKISGNMLPKSVSEGTLYVLDQDNLLVTSGKFNYIY